MEIRIRPYRTTDWTFLVRCMEGLQSDTISIDPFHDLVLRPGFGEKSARWELRWVRAHAGQIFVAASGGGPVGLVSVAVYPQSRIEQAAYRPVLTGGIVDLFVLPERRGKGVGTALLRHAETHLRRKGCNRIRLSVFAPNTRARALYRSLGYADVDIRMMKQVRPLRRVRAFRASAPAATSHRSHR